MSTQDVYKFLYRLQQYVNIHVVPSQESLEGGASSHHKWINRIFEHFSNMKKNSRTHNKTIAVGKAYNVGNTYQNWMNRTINVLDAC